MNTKKLAAAAIGILSLQIPVRSSAQIKGTLTRALPAVSVPLPVVYGAPLLTGVEASLYSPAPAPALALPLPAASAPRLPANAAALRPAGRVAAPVEAAVLKTAPRDGSEGSREDSPRAALDALFDNARTAASIGDPASPVPAAFDVRAALPGVVGVTISRSERSPYAEDVVTVFFGSRASMERALKARLIPKTLRHPSGEKYRVEARLSETASLWEDRDFALQIGDFFRSVPGVTGALVAPSLIEQTVHVTFNGRAALESARKAGLIPKTMRHPNGEKYRVEARLSEEEARREDEEFKRQVLRPAEHLVAPLESAVLKSAPHGGAAEPNEDSPRATLSEFFDNARPAASDGNPADLSANIESRSKDLMRRLGALFLASSKVSDGLKTALTSGSADVVVSVRGGDRGMSDLLLYSLRRQWAMTGYQLVDTADRGALISPILKAKFAWMTAADVEELAALPQVKRINPQVGPVAPLAPASKLSTLLQLALLQGPADAAVMTETGDVLVSGLTMSRALEIAARADVRRIIHRRSSP